MVNLITDHIDIWTAAQKQKTSGAGRGNHSANRSLFGIKKLRELILELAVRGKLVPQDPSDEPASILLEKIAKEKARLIKEGKLKKQEPLAEITKDEIPFGIPKTWAWSRLGDITIIQTGTLDANASSPDGDYPFFTCAKEPLRIDNYRYDTEAVLLAGNGNFDVNYYSGKFEAYQRTYIIEAVTRPLIYIPFIHKFIIKYTDKLKGQAIGGVIKYIKIGFLTEALLPLPPLAEQYRIVTKVDELMAICDQLEQKQTDSNAARQTLVETLLDTLSHAANQDEFVEAWQRVASHFDILFTTEQSIDQLKQTILQLAVMGKLVPQDPNDESANVLLKKIVAEKERLMKEGKIKKQESLSEITDNEKPFELPQLWEWVHLGDIATLKGGFAYKSSAFSGCGKHQVIRMGNIRPDYLRLDENPVCIPDDLAESTAEYKIELNDILLTMTGTKGKRDYLYSLIVRPEHLTVCELYLNQRLCIIKGLLLVPEFLTMIIKDDRLLDAMYGQSTGTANQANIGMSAINNWVLPLPPLAEQHRIVAKVDELMSMCDSLKARINDAQTTQVQLADTIVEQVMA